MPKRLKKLVTANIATSTRWQNAIIALLVIISIRTERLLWYHFQNILYKKVKKNLELRKKVVTL